MTGRYSKVHLQIHPSDWRWLKVLHLRTCLVFPVSKKTRIRKQATSTASRLRLHLQNRFFHQREWRDREKGMYVAPHFSACSGPQFLSCFPRMIELPEVLMTFLSTSGKHLRASKWQTLKYVYVMQEFIYVPEISKLHWCWHSLSLMGHWFSGKSKHPCSDPSSTANIRCQLASMNQSEAGHFHSKGLWIDKPPGIHSIS